MLNNIFMSMHYFNPYNSDDDERDMAELQRVSNALRIATTAKIHEFVDMINAEGGDLYTLQGNNDHVITVGRTDSSIKFDITFTDDGKVEFPLYPVVNGSLIKATVETPVYNINKIGAKALYEKFLEYNDIVLENYGEDIRRLENGETVTNLTVREEDLERYLR